MIQGVINETLEPIVEIGLKGQEAVERIYAIVDTGFSGHLCLSQHHVDKLTMVFHHVERYELANGEVLVAEVFRGTIEFDGEDRGVDVIVTASQDRLIGASLLQDYILTVDYPQRYLKLERRV